MYVYLIVAAKMLLLGGYIKCAMLLLSIESSRLSGYSEIIYLSVFVVVIAHIPTFVL
jgi:hypothetical protein